METNSTLIPRIGVAAVVIRDGDVLLGKRKGSHGAGEWACPGGHLDFGETVVDCAIRELAEETGLKGLSARVGPFIEGFNEEAHFVTFFVFIDSFQGEPQLLEPDKCDRWEWFNLNQLPEPLFHPTRTFFERQNEPDLKFLLNRLLALYRERDWEKFHSPKNLVMDLASEMGELVEPFRWLTEEQSYAPGEKALEEIKDELGDVFSVLIYLAHKLGIDPIQATHRKLEKIRKKYPAELCRGKCLKYTAYEP